MTDYTDLKDRVMTFETLGGLWVCAEDYVELETQVAALQAERDALREAIINRLHHYDEATGEDRCGCGACEPLFAALTATTTAY